MKNINRVNDLTGRKFGRLTVIGIEERNSRKTYWVCQCDCGNIKIARSDALLSGATKSCGCLKKEQDKTNLDPQKITKHHLYNTRIYHIWQGMKARCDNPRNTRYHRYGGRGIKVCEEWENDFKAFHDWAIANGYEETLTIDRIDNDKGYSPDNCRWSDKKEQGNNRKTTIKITIGNATKSLTEWCEIFQINYSAAEARYNSHEEITLDDLFNSKG